MPNFPGPIYGMTDAESKALKQHIDKELATGKIRPSTSSAGAPVMFVKKADGSLRLVTRRPHGQAKACQDIHQTGSTLGYNNVRIKEGDEWKTAFRTKYGLFEYLVMPFGLTNAPAAFQHFMNDLFRDLIDVTVHASAQLTRKETPWSWGNLEEAAFQELKVLVTKSPVLIHSNPGLPYYLETNASGVAMGAILSQRGSDNRLHPIAYMSKSFSGAEANYDTHDKELLAIIKALEEWRIFLEATDKPIQTRAMAHLPEHFNFEIHYCPGKQSGKPDALSRRSDYIDAPQEPEIMLPAKVFANTSEEELEIVTEVRSKIREDPSLELIIQFLTEDADNAPPSIQKPIETMIGRKNYYGHPGQQRTLELISRSYWWPGMKSSAKEWVKCCPTCQANRRARAPAIALKPLEVPPSLFHTVSYNFITGFPKSNGHNAILVVINSFSKFVTWTTGQNSLRPRDNVHREIPKGSIPTPWDQTLILIGLPSGVRRSNRKGESIHQFYLRSYVAADHLDWASWLPLAEYAYNNAKHSATGKTPFELVYGRNPVMNPSNVPANVPEADNVADTLAQEWKEAESALRMTKERMAGTKGVIPEFSIGEKVWLDAKNVEIRSNSNKLDPKRLGPFKITERISSHAYCLELPATMKIHDVFYVGLLSKVHESPSQPLPERPPPETIEGEEEYKVEQIIDSKKQRGKWFYLIKWKGYGPEDNSWEPEELLEHSQEEIKRFNQARLRKACDAAKSL
ncbi:hypothetical protein RHS01_11053 [Rhizoctonia solani]|uniref:Chromo domain-containing protein n=1 Tax=Rhizoctonia solani TaxID=456999 RepID=A0A8H7I2A8_9AGAM|nr:hypothetical protein RHS01_11053 [Rhizoctonia solani]